MAKAQLVGVAAAGGLIVFLLMQYIALVTHATHPARQHGAEIAPVTPAMGPADVAVGADGIVSVSSEVERLQQLHDQGALSPQEFAAAKAKIFGLSLNAVALKHGTAIAPPPPPPPPRPPSNTARVREAPDKFDDQADLDAVSAGSCAVPDGRRSQYMLYNRIGKAGSSTVNGYLDAEVRAGRGAGITKRVKGDFSNEFLTQAGEVELLQKLVGMKWFIDVPAGQKVVYDTHVFFIDFKRYPAFPPPMYINVMRDPVSRYNSQYHFWRVLGDIKPSLLAHGASLRQCTNQSAADFQQYGCPPLNYQTRYFCGHHSDCVDPPDAWTYARARSNLLQRYVWVGQLERLPESLRVLQKVLPDWFLGGEDAIASTKQKRNKQKQYSVPDKTLDAQIRAANHYDQKLYEFAGKLLDARKIACGV